MIIHCPNCESRTLFSIPPDQLPGGVAYRGVCPGCTYSVLIDRKGDKSESGRKSPQPNVTPSKSAADLSGVSQGSANR